MFRHDIVVASKMDWWFHRWNCIRLFREEEVVREKVGKGGFLCAVFTPFSLERLSSE